MNKEDIVRMAREAGYNAHIATEHFGSFGYISQDRSDSTMEKFNRLEDFAALVASAEREACAKLLEQAAEAAKNTDPQGFVWRAVKESAEAIRARGQA